MNILHLNDKIDIKGGVEVYVEQLMHLLPQYNCQPYWIGIYPSSSGLYHLKVFENNQENQDNINFNSLIRFLESYVVKNNIDVIHIHSISDPKLIKGLFKLKPVIRSMHEPRIVCPGQGKFWRKSERICNKPLGLHCVYHAYKEGCCNRHPKRLLASVQNAFFETSVGKDNYSSIIAMSSYMVNEALLGGFKKEQISFNPLFTPFISEEVLVDCSSKPIKKLLYVGRLSKTKGVHYLIEAAKKIVSKHQDVLIEIAGSGHDEEYIKSQVPDEFTRFFKFYGWLNREEINELMSKSYLVVFPSIYPEAFGIVGIEAMMRGKPVVGFDVGGVKTWLKDGATGFVAKIKNTNDLSDKILKLIEDKKLYQDFSRRSREEAIKDFSPNIHLEKLIQLYNDIKQ